MDEIICGEGVSSRRKLCRTSNRPTSTEVRSYGGSRRPEIRGNGWLENILQRALLNLLSFALRGRLSILLSGTASAAESRHRHRCVSGWLKERTRAKRVE